MGIKEDVLDMKNEVKDIKEVSLAREILHDYKTQNKRQFIIIIILLIFLFMTICYLLFVLNEKNTDEIAYTQISDIKDSELYLGI